MVGGSPHHIQSTSDFVSKAKGLTLQPGECLTSYDVTSLFTSIPTDPALTIIKDLLEKDEKLNDRMVLSIQNIIDLLGFCLNNTYFSFQNKFYEQVEGAPMGSPVSPVVANLYMEGLKENPYCLPSTPPQVWYRFVDDTWVIQQQASKQVVLDHINNVDPAIKFTVEGIQGNGAIPFFDTLVILMADNSLSISVYQKPTHTDLYLNWDSHQSLSAKYSVIGTLTHRAKVVCTNLELLKKELTHWREALDKCNYPFWAINKVQSKVLNNNLGENGQINSQGNTGNPQTVRANNNINDQTTQLDNNTGSSNATSLPRPQNKVGFITIPYIRQLVESFNHTCSKYGIQIHFKGNSTIKQRLMKPKDQDPKENKSGLIYSYRCQDIACDEEYTGETGCTLGERTREHLKQTSAIYTHIQ